MYNRHPSKALADAFAAKPYQGAAPELAKYLFVGLDANYDEKIDASDIFSSLLAYLDDGVAFWSERGVHHPFLLPGYNGNGKFYHRTFKALGFRAEDAGKVCFIELVDVPTYGRSNLVPGDLDPAHLQRLNRAILSGAARYVFIPDRVGKLMNASGYFPWMPRLPRRVGGALKLWHQHAGKTVYWHYHLSVYGKAEREKRIQLGAIRALVEREERGNASDAPGA